jgi:hypothetical protein
MDVHEHCTASINFSVRRPKITQERQLITYHRNEQKELVIPLSPSLNAIINDPWNYLPKQSVNVNIHWH